MFYTATDGALALEVAECARRSGTDLRSVVFDCVKQDRGSSFVFNVRQVFDGRASDRLDCVLAHQA